MTIGMDKSPQTFFDEDLHICDTADMSQQRKMEASRMQNCRRVLLRKVASALEVLKCRRTIRNRSCGSVIGLSI